MSGAEIAAVGAYLVVAFSVMVAFFVGNPSDDLEGDELMVLFVGFFWLFLLAGWLPLAASRAVARAIRRWGER